MRLTQPHLPGPRSGLPRWPPPPRRTARLRLTILYGAAFLVCGACGAALITATYLLYGHLTPSLVSHATIDKYGHVKHLVHTYPLPTHAPSMTVNVLGGHFVLHRQQLLVVSVIAAAVFVLAAAALGWLLAGRVLRPLSTITAAARRISASSLHERLALAGPDDELKELADTLDDLFTRLEASFETQRRFAANASHELRTPLTRERTLLQVTIADPAATTSSWQAVGRELLACNAEQEHLIEALLTLASSEAAPGDRGPADLADIAGAVVAAARPAIGRLGLHVRADLRPAALDGDPLLIQQLVTNLVDNAVRHNLPGGHIEISTRTSQAGAVLAVANSGPVIPDAEADRLFQPFHRLGPRPARRDGGHGLGLSIVRAIATAHGATITAATPPGGGLAIEVTFPPPPDRRTAPGV